MLPSLAKDLQYINILFYQILTDLCHNFDCILPRRSFCTLEEHHTVNEEPIGSEHNTVTDISVSDREKNYLPAFACNQMTADE